MKQPNKAWVLLRLLMGKRAWWWSTGQGGFMDLDDDEHSGVPVDFKTDTGSQAPAVDLDSSGAGASAP